MPLPSPEGCGPVQAYSLATSTHAQAQDSSHMRPSPLERDLGSSLTHDRGTWVGGAPGGYQEVVGPPGASQQRATTFVVGRFHIPPTFCPTTSLACKSETEVVFYMASAPFAPPHAARTPPPSLDTPTPDHSPLHWRNHRNLPHND